MNILIAVIIFSLIVIFHELGHFSLAKANGIQVEEFSLGMGPRLITVVKGDNGFRVFILKNTNQLEDIADITGHTWYSLKLLLFGGSCMMLGEETEEESENAFNNKSVYARMSVIFAGPFFNFILAFALSIIIVGMHGYDPAVISDVEKGGQMEAAGFQSGDVVTEINGSNIVLNREISSYFQFSPLDGEPVELTIERDGKEITKKVTPVLTKRSDGTECYLLGFTYGAEPIKTNALGTLKYSAYEVRYWIVTTVKSVGSLIRGKISKDDIAGPVGIVNIVGDSIDSAKANSDPQDATKNIVLTLINFCILLSANLGVMNLLPIPALDGGRLLFLIIEWIRRKPLNPKFEGVVNFAGFAALMVLMVFVMFNDIVKLF